MHEHRKYTHHYTKTRHDASSASMKKRFYTYMKRNSLASPSYFSVPCSTGDSQACRRVIASIPSVFPRMHSSGHRSQTTSPSHSSHSARINLAAPGVRASSALCFAFVVIGDKRIKKKVGERWLRTARQKPLRGADQERVSLNGSVTCDRKCLTFYKRLLVY